ncbi:hypothetical protein DAPPUDRAFT_335728 [Daphnia pulex]|uniref:Uncharacterized protein n=1 Tax=Daphnia pulex TaxID=6669 RepID=E9HYD0_DAPPU|nr:hypothetical protein DAPPUDRAFT_335728 [Daphnia pulex]|eukprot:EFX63248.1 hypothetical protein DAPPUDRAFT_335728 [Daphnia pulex]
MVMSPYEKTAFVPVKCTSKQDSVAVPTEKRLTFRLSELETQPNEDNCELYDLTDLPVKNHVSQIHFIIVDCFVHGFFGDKSLGEIQQILLRDCYI